MANGNLIVVLDEEYRHDDTNPPPFPYFRCLRERRVLSHTDEPTNE